MLWKRRDALSHQVWCEQLGKRRSNALDPGLGLAEGHVRFGREPHTRQHVSLVLHLLTGHSERLTEPDPHLDPAGARLRAVVIDDPRQPQTSNIWFRTIGENRRVLPRNRTLIRQSIGNPALQLSSRQLTPIHHVVN